MQRLCGVTKLPPIFHPSKCKQQKLQYNLRSILRKIFLHQLILFLSFIVITSNNQSKTRTSKPKHLSLQVPHIVYFQEAIPTFLFFFKQASTSKAKQHIRTHQTLPYTILFSFDYVDKDLANVFLSCRICLVLFSCIDDIQNLPLSFYAFNVYIVILQQKKY